MLLAACCLWAGQSSCPFGDGVLCLSDGLIASETCEELFTPQAPHISLALAGVEIISNGSGSHHQLRKLDQRLDLIRGATAKVNQSERGEAATKLNLQLGVPAAAAMIKQHQAVHLSCCMQAGRQCNLTDSDLVVHVVLLSMLL